MLLVVRRLGELPVDRVGFSNDKATFGVETSGGDITGSFVEATPVTLL